MGEDKESKCVRLRVGVLVFLRALGKSELVREVEYLTT